MTKPVGIEKLTLDNHSLYARVQHLVRLGWKWEAIADDINVPNVKAICDWVLAYREPKLSVYRNGGYISDVPVKSSHKPTKEEQTAKFIAWKRARDGAETTRINNEMNDALG